VILAARHRTLDLSRIRPCFGVIFSMTRSMVKLAGF
jgi:hypothetical protein